jgi:thiamine-monophosphate kinase
LSRKPVSEASIRIRDLGEFGLIERLRQRIEARCESSPLAGPPVIAPRTSSLASQAPRLELGIGDDAAVWRPLDGARQVATTDALIEDIHFRLSTTTWRDLGWKSLAVNVSDLAAMGATPRYALVTLGLPGETVLADVLELYDGLLELCREFDVAVAGGDVVRTPMVVLSITAIGEASGELLRRDCGRPGDILAVTGTLGASAAGLRLLHSNGRPANIGDRFLQAHLRPRPRVLEAAKLVEAGLRCAIDLSDGLAGDATHLCESSGVGAVIETDRVPMDAALESEFGDQALSIAIGGGEDYELLCAGPSDAIQQARVALAELGTPLTIVGRLTEPPVADEPLVRLVDSAGRAVELETRSWDHFRA